MNAILLIKLTTDWIDVIDTVFANYEYYFSVKVIKGNGYSVPVVHMKCINELMEIST